MACQNRTLKDSTLKNATTRGPLIGDKQNYYHATSFKLLITKCININKEDTFLVP